MTTKLLQPKPVSTRQFDYDRENHRYVGEISDTNGFGRVYDDSCDEGLTLVSARTGRQVVFVVESVDHDREGEIVSWTLVPAAKRPALDVTVLLFND